MSDRLYAFDTATGEWSDLGSLPKPLAGAALVIVGIVLISVHGLRAEAGGQAWIGDLMFLGSSCIYPKLAPQPLKEESLLTDSLEPTNRPYAVAKIAGIEMCWSYNRQYKTKYLAAMPTNLYGLGDNYHPQNSHVIPGLLRRFHEALCNDSSSVTIWGTGTPRREFLFADDLGEACVFLLNLPDNVYIPICAQERSDGIPPMINIGVGEDITISELSEKIKEVVGFSGAIQYDTTKPDGTPRKLMDISRLRSYGWQAKTDLDAGLRFAYADFKKKTR